MAKRQSLKELQERLAQRLAAAKTEASSAMWLAVEASGRRYLLPLVQSGEIFPWAPVQQVPYAKPWYVGVVNLRGGLFGVIDTAALIAGHSPGTGIQQRVGSESRLVSLHTAFNINAVLWIDRLLGLRNPGSFRAVADRPQELPPYITRVLLDEQGQDWQELDLQALVSEPAFLAIAA